MAHDDVELVAVNDQQLPAVGGFVQVGLANLDAAEMRPEITRAGIRRDCRGRRSAARPCAPCAAVSAQRRCAPAASTSRASAASRRRCRRPGRSSRHRASAENQAANRPGSRACRDECRKGIAFETAGIPCCRICPAYRAVANERFPLQACDNRELDREEDFGGSGDQAAGRRSSAHRAADLAGDAPLALPSRLRVVVNGRDAEATRATAREIARKRAPRSCPLSPTSPTRKARRRCSPPARSPISSSTTMAGRRASDFRELDRADILEGVTQNMVAAIELIQKVIDGMTSARLRPHRQHHLDVGLRADPRP